MDGGFSAKVGSAMMCPSCHSAELQGERRVFGHVAEDGRSLQIEVDALVCPACHELFLSGKTAEQISNRWFSVGNIETPALPPVGISDTWPPTVAGVWPWAKTLVA